MNYFSVRWNETRHTLLNAGVSPIMRFAKLVSPVRFGTRIKFNLVSNQIRDSRQLILYSLHQNFINFKQLYVKLSNSLCPFDSSTQIVSQDGMAKRRRSCHHQRKSKSNPRKLMARLDVRPLRSAAVRLERLKLLLLPEILLSPEERGDIGADSLTAGEDRLIKLLLVQPHQ